MTARHVAVILAVLGLAVAGCGGDDSLAPQVPGPPADVAVPASDQSPTEAASGSQDAGSGDSNTNSTSKDSGDTSTSDSSGSGDTGTTGDTSTGTTGDTSTGTTGGGATAPETQADSQSNDTAPPAGSDAQQFEDFCAQNPGAC